MYTRSYGSRPSITSRPVPPDYGGTALVIPQPEPEPILTPRPEPTPNLTTPPRPTPQPPADPSPPSGFPPPPDNRPPQGNTPPQGNRPPQGTPPQAPPPPPGNRPLRPPRPTRPRFSGRRNPPITTPPMPNEPDYDPRRPEDIEPPAADRRDPLGAPPFGGLGIPPFKSPASVFNSTVPPEVSGGEQAEALPAATEDSSSAVSHPLFPFTALTLRQDDLLLLGLLLFLLHEQDEGDTDCRDALLLLAVLFVAGM